MISAFAAYQKSLCTAPARHSAGACLMPCPLSFAPACSGGHDGSLSRGALAGACIWLEAGLKSRYKCGLRARSPNARPGLPGLSCPSPRSRARQFLTRGLKACEASIYRTRPRRTPINTVRLAWRTFNGRATSRVTTKVP